jgi:alpha-galactosidase
MLAEIQDTLSNAKTHFPDYRGQDFELAGFVWFQGWNDMVNSDYTAAYAENMVHFIRDVRRDLNAEGLPFVIGQLGVGGEGEQDKKREAFKAAQAAPSELEEFRGNVALVRTDAYWDTQAQAVFDKGWKEHLEEWNTVGSDRPYHYLGSHKTMAGIGGGFAQALLDLRAGE